MMLGSLLDRPLDDAELDRLSDLLDALPSEDAMSLEGMDGFFSALICAPQAVSMGLAFEYVWGVGSDDEPAFADAAEVSEFMGLAMRHWNAISAGLAGSKDGDPATFHMPLLFSDDGGIARGNEWASGFWRGMRLDFASWRELVDDPDHGGAVLPVMALAHEHDPDPAMRPEPISDERRVALVTYMAAGLHEAWRYFAAQRRELASQLQQGSRTVVREEPKVGRNEPCPCGSGRKYKRCHGAA
jgi:uncharacterized protein